MLHSQKGEEKKKKKPQRSEPKKETCFIHKVTHIQKTRCSTGRYQPPLIYSRSHTPPPLITPPTQSLLPLRGRPRIVHEALSSLSDSSEPVLSSRGRGSGGPNTLSPRRREGGVRAPCPVSNLPGLQKFGQILHPQAAHVGVI